MFVFNLSVMICTDMINKVLFSKGERKTGLFIITLSVFFEEVDKMQTTEIILIWILHL